MTILKGLVYITGERFYLFYTDEKIYGLYNNLQVKYIKTVEGELVPAIRTNIVDIENLTDEHMFSLLHECGHFVNNHISTKPMTRIESILDKIKERVIGRDSKIEIEADSYAVEHLGKNRCIEVLSKGLQNPDVSKAEIQKRIDAIKELGFFLPKTPFIIFYNVNEEVA